MKALNKSNSFLHAIVKLRPLKTKNSWMAYTIRRVGEQTGKIVQINHFVVNRTQCIVNQREKDFVISIIPDTGYRSVVQSTIGECLE